MAKFAAALVVLLVTLDAAFSLLLNATLKDLDKNDLMLDTRRTKKKKKERSTSSSSGDKKDDSSGDAGESLGISSESITSSKSKDTKYPKPKSSAERRGWRKWHRKCVRCPYDMVKKWRDPSIQWICGAYQHARRSFKSLCMMHYRNCQDGTMFIKISDHRCANSSVKEEFPRGEHFFYDYKAPLSGDSSESKSSGTTTSVEESSNTAY